jgi:hypothetical protein
MSTPREYRQYAFTRAPLVLFISGTLVLLVGIALIFQWVNSRRLRADVHLLRSQIEDQQVLYPLYSQLMKAAQPAAWSGLPAPAKQPLTRADILDIPSRITALAAGAGYAVSAVRPRVEAPSEGEPQQLRVEIEATGPYDRLRDFLVALAAQPALRQVRDLSVQRTALQEEVRIVAWMALEEGGAAAAPAR